MRRCALLVILALFWPNYGIGQQASEASRPYDMTKATLPMLNYYSHAYLVQSTYLIARKAGLCRLRSDAFVNALQAAQDRVWGDAIRFKLSSEEARGVLAAVNQAVAQDEKQKGPFDVTRHCQQLRDSGALNYPDKFYREITEHR